MVLAERLRLAAAHAAVAGVNGLQHAVGGPELEDPVRRQRPGTPSAFLLSLPLLHVGGLAVDVVQPQGVPDLYAVELTLPSLRRRMTSSNSSRAPRSGPRASA